MSSPNMGPLRVQIQTQSGCNGRCVFCPNEGVSRSQLAQGQMEPELFRKIVDELAELRPRRISPYLMNEPLLDRRLPAFVRYISSKVPDATTLVTTNGTHLTEECAADLIDAGLKRIKVSLQSLNPEVNKSLMGQQCDSDKVVQNILTCQRVMHEKRARHCDLRVSMIVTKLNEREIAHAHKFWRRHGVRLVTSALENRGGNISQAESLNAHPMTQFSRQCVRPDREMCILWNGDVVLCCVDWWRTVRLGNLAEQSIREVWNGDKLKGIRNALREGDEERLPQICVNCAESAEPVHRFGNLKRVLRKIFPA